MQNYLHFIPPYNGFVTALKLHVHAMGTPVVLCIGSDRLTGDCLGPMVGNLLVNTYNIPTYVYGTLSHTVTALNLESTFRFIQERHPRTPVLVIDASLGDAEDIGQIRIKRGGICPGSASGKNFASIGDLAITAVVNRLPSSTLSSTKLGFVHDLSHIIAVSVASAVSEAAYTRETC